MLFLDGDDVGTSQRLKERRRLGVVISGYDRPQAVNTIRALARIGDEGEVVAHFPARKGQHPCQLAASGDGNPHQSTAWGTLSVCRALQS